MDIIRDIAQIRDAAIRYRLEANPPRTIDGAFAALSELLAMRHGPVAIDDGRLTIVIEGVAVTLRSGDHAAHVGLRIDDGPITEASVRSLPMLEQIFTDSLAAARTIAALRRRHPDA